MKADVKNRILQEGARLVHRKGFHATGVAEVVEAAGVPKGSFYFYFDSKEAFGLELVDAYARRFQIQEDLVRQVAHEMMDSGHARGVRVRSTARHLCMCSRGPSNHTAETTTEFALGSLAGG